MNCKPGDLAYVKRSTDRSQVGMIVMVHEIHIEWTSCLGEPVRKVSFKGMAIAVNNGEVLSGSGNVPDADLVPITGVPVHDEHLDEVPA